MITYESCMEAAGAEVHTSADFGSYQGTSCAVVTYDGQLGFVIWNFGSCSGCDSLQFKQSEIGWSRDMTAEEQAAFGKEYLDEILTAEQAEARAAENAAWSLEDAEMLAWIREKAVEFGLVEGPPAGA